MKILTTIFLIFRLSLPQAALADDDKEMARRLKPNRLGRVVDHCGRFYHAIGGHTTAVAGLSIGVIAVTATVIYKDAAPFRMMDRFFDSPTPTENEIDPEIFSRMFKHSYFESFSRKHGDVSTWFTGVQQFLINVDRRSPEFSKALQDAFTREAEASDTRTLDERTKDLTDILELLRFLPDAKEESTPFLIKIATKRFPTDPPLADSLSESAMEVLLRIKGLNKDNANELAGQLVHQKITLINNPELFLTMDREILWRFLASYFIYKGQGRFESLRLTRTERSLLFGIIRTASSENFEGANPVFLRFLSNYFVNEAKQHGAFPPRPGLNESPYKVPYDVLLLVEKTGLTPTYLKVLTGGRALLDFEKQLLDAHKRGEAWR